VQAHLTNIQHAQISRLLLSPILHLDCSILYPANLFLQVAVLLAQLADLIHKLYIRLKVLVRLILPVKVEVLILLSRPSAIGLTRSA
jgi:hypothetical protein